MDTESVTIPQDHKKSEEQEALVHSYLIDSLFNSVGISIIILDIKGIIIQVNEYTQEIIGYSRKEMIGQPAIQFIHPDDQADTRSKFRSVISGDKTPYSVERRFINKDGRIVWADMSINTIRNSKEEIIGIIGIVKDISSRKQTESAFQHSEEKYRMFIQKIQAAVMVYDNHNHLLLLNRKAYELLGITNPGQWDPGTFDKEWIMLDEKGEALPPESYPVYQVIQTQQPLSDRTLGLRKTKGHKVLWVTVNAIPLFDENNRFFQVIVTFMDISPQKKAEQLVKQNNERLESLLRIAQYSADSSDDLINMVLHEALKLSESRYGFIYTYQENNQILLHHSSIRMDQDYQPVACIIHPMDICKDWCREAISERKAIRKKNLNILQDDQSISNALILPVIIDNEIKAIIGIADKSGEYTNSDHHQITLMMDTVWKIIEKFNHREELIRAKEKAEEGDRLKSAFLCNMSHEIRTPMNGIIGFANLLTTPDISEQKRTQYTTIINESCQQLLSIVNDILDISKIETGQMQINSETTNVNNILLELFSFYKPNADKSNLNLYFKQELSDQEATISTDRIKLKQILSNLISNAIKFTHQGYIEYGYNRHGDTLEFFIRDTGIGIRPEFHSFIFDRFRQGETSLTRQYGGTGLGLAISKAYVELLGGKIWVTSSPTEGSTFFFTIPYHPVFLPQPAPIGSNPLILVAEDEETNYFYIEQVLLEKHYTILHAKNGKEAVACCQGNPHISLVMMDIKMPIMNGIEAAKQIKSFRPELIIIAQTAFAMAEDRQQMMNHGFDDYISKPMTQDQLLSCVGKWIEKPVVVP
ncbi:MAG: PAS domain S-box protein [Candidatus Delongbacteria bacterium]|nr:PAS domain S-box protein [Candidatus Delongbacteria bacterium]